MKKLILTIIALIYTVNCSVAQDVIDIRSKLMVGAKLGLSYSNVYDSQGEDFAADPKLGFVTGGFLAIPIGKYIGVQPEILFSQRGFHAKGRILGSTYEMTRTSNYLDVPLLFAFKPAAFITFLAGPQFSYLLSQKDEFKNATTSIAQEQEFENEDIRKNTLCFLTGVDINVKHLVLGARVGWDIQNNNNDGSSTTPRYKNVWYQATIGIRLY